MKTLIALAGAAAMLGGVAHAQSEDKNPWQECGIGAIIFPDNGTAAAISNIIWDLGTTAVTSASSSPGSCEGEGFNTAVFIKKNYDQVETELAQGAGDFAAALPEVMACSEEVRPAVLTSIRGDLALAMAGDEFGAMDANARAEQLFNIADRTASETFKGQCYLS